MLQSNLIFCALTEDIERQRVVSRARVAAETYQATKTTNELNGEFLKLLGAEETAEFSRRANTQATQFAILCLL
jgi:hypothetical protein